MKKRRKINYAAIGRLGGLSRSKAKITTARANGAKSKGAPQGNQNAHGARRLHKCVCGWKGKRRKGGGICPQCGTLVN